MEIDLVIKFLVASMALTFMPGPDNIFVLSESINKGAKTGIYISLGLVSGVLVHTALAFTGLSLLLTQNPNLFDMVRYVGSAYLFYLSYQAYGELNLVMSLNKSQTNTGHFYKLYAKGITMNVLNPKVTLFFLAFLPQFVNFNSTVPSSLQMLVLGLVFMVQAIVIFSLISILAARFASYIDNPTFWKISNISRVVILLLLGLSLLLS